jgi:hypothetical protein
MSRLLAVLLVCLCLVLPSADLVCRASCTPVETAVVAVPSCHDVGRDIEHDRIVSTVSCQREASLAARVADVRRVLAVPHTMAETVTATAAAAALAAVHRPHDWLVRPRARQAFPPCIVLRV